MTGSPVMGPGWYRLDELVRITALVPVRTKLRVKVLAGANHVSMSSFTEAALTCHIIREERSMRRDQRAKINELFRQADEWRPIDELLADAAATVCGDADGD
jgi:hypothetical protein